MKILILIWFGLFVFVIVIGLLERLENYIKHKRRNAITTQLPCFLREITKKEFHTQINVRAKSFWQFRKLIRLAETMGYKFSRKYNTLYLWIFWGARGICIIDFEDPTNHHMKFLDTFLDDEITFEEFLNIIR